MSVAYPDQLPVGRYPDGAIVAAQWITDIPSIQVDISDTQFPWDLDVPFRYGYAQVTVVGGVPNQNAAFFTTMVQCDFWVEAPSADRIFRMQAQDLAKQVQLAALDRKHSKRAVTPKPYEYNGTQITYQACHVDSVYCLQEPHDIVSPDNQMYAGCSMDIMLTWALSGSTP